MGALEEKKLKRYLRAWGIEARRDKGARLRGAKVADLVVGAFVIEEKTTSGGAASLLDAWSRKLHSEAAHRGRLPLLVLQTPQERYAILPLEVFLSVCKEEVFFDA